MAFFTIISIISLGLALLSAVIVLFHVSRHSQPMVIMNVVWPLTALWSGLAGLWCYFSFGKTSKGMVKQMDMPDMNMSGNMKSMDMEPTGFRQKVMLSTFHCGAGCTLADIFGESFGHRVLEAAGLSGIGWNWGLDYLLALIIGAFFQYAAIRPMMKQQSVPKVFIKAFRIDFLSLTVWQIGMYLFTSFIFFVVLPQPLVCNDWRFWFVMQLAMCAGFILAYPMNGYLIRKGIKPAM